MIHRSLCCGYLRVAAPCLSPVSVPSRLRTHTQEKQQIKGRRAFCHVAGLKTGATQCRRSNIYIFFYFIAAPEPALHHNTQQLTMQTFDCSSAVVMEL